MDRLGFALMVGALASLGVSGCATKNYVRTQTAPLADHASTLENEAADNTRNLKDVDNRAQSGIQKAQSSADAANQNAQNASQSAGNAQNAANDAVHRADSLDSVVKGLDNYKQVADVTVNFGFDKSVLTADAKDQLDSFASRLGSASNFILEVTGGCDSTGPKQYNYQLSVQRADAVVQYLAAKYNVAPHRFYLIGIGKDQEVASNSTAQGRLKNRRVEVQMLTNMSSDQQTASSAQGSNGAGAN